MPLVELVNQFRIQFEGVEGNGIRDAEHLCKSHKQEDVPLAKVFLVNSRAIGSNVETFVDFPQ